TARTALAARRATPAAMRPRWRATACVLADGPRGSSVPRPSGPGGAAVGTVMATSLPSPVHRLDLLDRQLDALGSGRRAEAAAAGRAGDRPRHLPDDGRCDRVDVAGRARRGPPVGVRAVGGLLIA